MEHLPPTAVRNSGSKPAVVEEAATADETRVNRGWIVVLHNDDHHTFDYVIKVLITVVHHPLREAMRLTMRIHNEGSAVVAGPMSRYEADQIAHKISSFGPDPYSRRPKLNVGLKATVEPG